MTVRVISELYYKIGGNIVCPNAIYEFANNAKKLRWHKKYFFQIWHGKVHLHLSLSPYE